jgi:hypothetical protein
VFGKRLKKIIKISAKDSLGYFQLKHKPWFDEGCPKILDQGKQAKLQWLQDPSEVNGDNLNNDMKPADQLLIRFSAFVRY